MVAADGRQLEALARARFGRRAAQSRQSYRPRHVEPSIVLKRRLLKIVLVLMIAAGFLVLTMGEARPLKNVGGLTAAAMLVAAAATFLAVPVLARRLQYRRTPSPSGEADEEDSVEVVPKRVELGGSDSQK